MIARTQVAVKDVLALKRGAGEMVRRCGVAAPCCAE
jgi:hypothetical protein